MTRVLAMLLMLSPAYAGETIIMICTVGRPCTPSTARVTQHYQDESIICGLPQLERIAKSAVMTPGENEYFSIRCVGR